MQPEIEEFPAEPAAVVLEARVGEVIEIPAGGTKLKIVAAGADGMNPTAPAVGWGTLALINAVLAQSKNRSGFLWFLGSMFVGPVATFFLAVCDPLPPEEPKTT